ncbi:hypothetical protein FV218_14405 [Methylobacterium sp. WL69]|nr:hypothetical protein FV218_14405 [Methylobacterium sp. WL69]
MSRKRRRLFRERIPPSAGEGGRGATGRGGDLSGHRAPLIQPASRATFSRGGEKDAPSCCDLHEIQR